MTNQKGIASVCGVCLCLISLLVGAGEETVKAETERVRVGKSTSLLVAQAERNLLVSQIAEIETVVSYLKSFVTLYRFEGSLLDRRGIDAPGKNTVAFNEN